MVAFTLTSVKATDMFTISKAIMFGGFDVVSLVLRAICARNGPLPNVALALPIKKSEKRFTN